MNQNIPVRKFYGVSGSVPHGNILRHFLGIEITLPLSDLSVDLFLLSFLLDHKNDVPYRGTLRFQACSS